MVALRPSLEPQQEPSLVYIRVLVQPHLEHTLRASLDQIRGPVRTNQGPSVDLIVPFKGLAH